ncbi:hypothetical protein THIOSC15_2340002 [uncultured Thiomicrorhabdus sp.]
MAAANTKTFEEHCTIILLSCLGGSERKYYVSLSIILAS